MVKLWQIFQGSSHFYHYFRNQIQKNRRDEVTVMKMTNGTAIIACFPADHHQELCLQS